MNLSHIARLLCLLIGFTLLPDRCGAQSSAPEIRACYYRNNMSGAYVVNSGNWQTFCVTFVASSYGYGQYYTQANPYAYSQQSVWNWGQTNLATYINAYTAQAPIGWTSVYVTNTAPTYLPGNYWEHRSESGTHYGIVTYTYDRDTKIELLTGGDTTVPVSPSLFRLTASVTVHTTDPYTGQFLNSSALAPGAFQIAGQTPDAAGNVWVTAVDQTTLDVTPTLSANATGQTPAFYSFTVTGANTKSKPQIIMADAPLDPSNPNGPWGSTNIANGAPISVIVGQQISLSCPLTILAGTLSNFTWTVPGNTISNWVVSQNSLGDTIEGTLYKNYTKTNDNVVFYWVDGIANATVTCTAQLNGVTLTSTATFNVLRPTYQITNEATGAVAINTSYHVNPGTRWLHLGRKTVAPGIKFFPVLITPVESNPTFEWLQIASKNERKWTETDGTSWKKAGPGLDTQVPYVKNTDSITAEDSPGEPVESYHTYVSADDAFEMHLMYKSARPGSILVPLRKMKWHWSGSATKIGGIWLLDYLPPGNQPTSNLPDENCTLHPTWTSRIQDNPLVPDP